MCDLVQLFAYGGVDVLHAVTVHVAPHGGVTVEVPVSVDVLQVDAVRARDDNGVLARVRAHLGERVPNEATVQVFETGLVVRGHIRLDRGLAKGRTGKTRNLHVLLWLRAPNNRRPHLVGSRRRGSAPMGPGAKAPGSSTGPDYPRVFGYCLLAPMLSRIFKGILQTIVYAGS